MTSLSSSLSISSAEDLQHALKRCRPEVINAAIEFRATGNPRLLPFIITGVIERFTEPEHRHLLRHGQDNLRLNEDLGLDSLTLMEIVLLTEDVFGINISAEELRNLCTLGEIQTFIATKTIT
jgi:3-hydroxyacyl-[acyl-carrier-protein] dehydratase